MSGWLDFFEVEIKCPFCNQNIIVTIWEDGDPKRTPVVITGLLDGKAICSNCKKEIFDKDLDENI